MGTGASVENARSTMANLLANKPADASDIKVNFYYNSIFKKSSLICDDRIWKQLVPKLEI